MDKKNYRGKLTPIIQISVGGIFMLSLVFLLIGAVGFQTVTPETKAFAKPLDSAVWTGAGDQKVTLPHSFQSLSPRTSIVLTVAFTPKQGDYLYVKSVYAPLKIYANDRLIYEYGQEGSYPSFLQDPATSVSIVPLTDISQNVNLRMEYLSPIARDVLTVHPVLLGSEAEIFNCLLSTMGFSLGFSLIQIFIGMLLVLVAIFLIFFERSGFAFFWIGLFAFFSGVWAFGECNLSGLLIHNPTLLYLFAFCGLFMMPIPLLYFGLTVMNFRDRRPLFYTANFMTGVAIISLLLQLFGVVALSKTMYLFQLLLMGSLLLFSANVLYEGVRYKNQVARRFFLPIATLALFCVLEWINYQLRFTNIISLFFQIGVLLFVLMTGVVGGLLVRDALQLSKQKQQLTFEVSLMEMQLAEERKHYELFLKNAEAVKAQRHDLRHQMAVIRSYSERGDHCKLMDYLNTLITQIPDEQGTLYCENIATNAIIFHYASLAEKSNIQLSIKLIVPKHLEEVSDTSLCVILGNCLENAIEGSLTVPEDERFIRVRVKPRGGLLLLTIDNSFDGVCNKRGEKYISRKRKDATEGIGLASVAAVVKTAGGTMRVEQTEKVFMVSVGLPIEA